MTTQEKKDYYNNPDIKKPNTYCETLSQSFQNLNKEESKLYKIFKKYKKPVCLKNEKDVFYISQENRIFNKKLCEALKQYELNNKVIYTGNAYSVELIMLLNNDVSNGILNCADYNPHKLLFSDIFFEVGTVFSKKDGKIQTRDKSSFGYEFKDEKMVGTINWIDLEN